MKFLLHSLLKIRIINGILAGLLKRTGHLHLSRRINFLVSGIPDAVSIPVESPGLKSSFKCISLKGKDQIVFQSYLHGWSHFEKPLPEILVKLCRNRKIFLDVGANTGYYSLLAAQVPELEKIYGFEPFPEVMATFRKNISMNRLGGKINPVQQALSDQSGNSKLYIPMDDHGLVETSSSLNPEFRDSHSKTVDIQKTTLDEFALQEELPGLDLLKIDVESFEHHVLTGAQESITKFRPIIIIEVLESSDIQALQSFLTQHNYLNFDITAAVVENSRLAPDEKSPNHIFLPAEKKNELLTVLR